MPYSIDQFAADCRDILKSDSGPAGRRQVIGKLEALLMEDDFVAEHCGPDAKVGSNLIYEDRQLGFQVLAHIMDKGYDGGPHDHGESWAIYGQAVKHTDMTDWRRTDDRSQEGKADIEPVRTYRMERGQAGIFDDGAIHSIAYPEGARFVRVTGCDLSTIARGRYNPEKGTMDVSKRENFNVTS
jgi:hypothetical protein